MGKSLSPGSGGAGSIRAVIGRCELPVGDLERAAAFYRRAFGWVVERLDWDGPAYAELRPPAASAGAPPAARAGLVEGWRGLERPLMVLHLVEGALEDCLERVAAEGGSVEQRPQPVGRMGRFATFRDSEGNLLGLWEPGTGC